MEYTNQGKVSITNGQLAEKCFSLKKSDRTAAVTNELHRLMNVEESNDQLETEISEIGRLFCIKFNTKLYEVDRSRVKFRQRYASWLQQKLQLPIIPDISSVKPGPSRARGRPETLFEEASIKTKKRRVKDLVSSRSSAELRFAAEMSAESLAEEQKSISPLQALALCLDLGLSDRKYKVLRSLINGMHKNCFPSLYSITLTKNALLPKNIIADEVSVCVNLQELLQLTAQSILKIASLEEGNEFNLICKWGFDGSSGHSQYKQTFSNALSTDEYLFLIAMVSLKLVDVRNGKVVWVNRRSSSTLYCRPIKLIFQKETADLVRDEEKTMKDIICKLQTSEIKFESHQIYSVSFEMLFTMLDGSVTNILSGTNVTSKCFICGATPKEMNNENVVNRLPDSEQYRFGLSTLHCWIKFFECILHIGYRLPIKKWQVRGVEHKAIVKENKKRIQSEFKSKMGLLIDKPKPGYGSSNDGNTARRFFANPDLSSEVTGVNKELIVKFSIILKVLASGYPINIDRFKMLLEETRVLDLTLYDWFCMPISVHKILVHGCEIISSFSLPIGQLSEDALEAKHKEVRKNRLNHTRKCSRVSSNFDLIRILLLTSEPLISDRRTLINKKVRVEEIQEYIILTEKPGQYKHDMLGIENLDLTCTDNNESSTDEDSINLD